MHDLNIQKKLGFLQDGYPLIANVNMGYTVKHERQIKTINKSSFVLRLNLGGLL